MPGEAITQLLLDRMRSTRHADGEPIPEGGWLLRYTATTRNFGGVCGVFFAGFLAGPFAFPPAEPMTHNEILGYVSIFGAGLLACVWWSIAMRDELSVTPWGLSYKRFWWQQPTEIRWEQIQTLTFYGSGTIREGTLKIESREGESIGIQALFMHGMPRLREQLKKHASGAWTRIADTNGLDRALPPL